MVGKYPTAKFRGILNPVKECALANICHKTILHLKEEHMLTFLLKTISHPQSIASIFQCIFHGEHLGGFIILKNVLWGAVEAKFCA